MEKITLEEFINDQHIIEDNEDLDDQYYDYETFLNEEIKAYSNISYPNFENLYMAKRYSNNTRSHIAIVNMKVFVERQGSFKALLEDLKKMTSLPIKIENVINSHLKKYLDRIGFEVIDFENEYDCYWLFRD